MERGPKPRKATFRIILPLTTSCLQIHPQPRCRNSHFASRASVALDLLLGRFRTERAGFCILLRFPALGESGLFFFFVERSVEL